MRKLPPGVKEQRNRDRARAFRLAHPEKVASANKEYRERERERIFAQRKAYRQRNAEAIRAKKKAEYAANRDNILAARKVTHDADASRKAVERSRRWAKANPERIRLLREKNKDRINAERRGKYVESPHAARQRAKEYRLRNRDVVLAKQAQRNRTPEARARQRATMALKRAENPESFRAYSLAHVARKRNAPGRGITAEQRADIMASTCGLCSYCSKRGPLEFDHIDPLRLGGAHDTENAAPACASCNASKNDTPLVLWLVRRARNKGFAA
jgi:5-methylcytosine-specific restriction endonuclease McrA